MDGEERVIGFDVIMDLYIKLYEDVNLDYICDVYGVHKELDVEYETYDIKTLLAQSTAVLRLQEKVPYNFKGEDLLQIKYSTAKIFPESAVIGNNCKLSEIITDKNVEIRSDKILNGSETYPVYIKKNGRI